MWLNLEAVGVYADVFLFSLLFQRRMNGQTDGLLDVVVDGEPDERIEQISFTDAERAGFTCLNYSPTTTTELSNG